MNHKEKKLKALMVDETLKYYKKYKGQCNKEQSKSLEDLKILTQAFEAVSMERFISDQKDYINLRSGSNMIYETMIRLRDEGKIPACTPQMIAEDYGHGTNYVHENYCYTLMEIYEGKHNDFLQQIIDKTKR